MINAKKIYQSIKPEFIKNNAGKIVEVCLDMNTYNAMVKACREWEKIQKKEGVRWVRISKSKETKK